jgi:hypothetical protein
MSDQPPKRPRRNLDALNTASEEKPISNVKSPLRSRRNIENLQEPDYINSRALPNGLLREPPSQPKSNRTRNLDGLEEDIQFDIKKREERREKRESQGGNDNRRRNKHVFGPPEEVKKVEEKTVDILDEQLFPSLGMENKQVPKEKVSIWNIINHNVTTVKPDLNNTTAKVDNTNKSININKKINNDTNQTYTYFDHNGDEIFEEVYENELVEEEEDEDMCDPDKNELENISNLLKQKYELEKNIEFVINTCDKSKVLHVNFLSQLEQKLNSVNDEIYRFESLENELESIYGPSIRVGSHIKYKSLYDEAVEVTDKRDQEEKFRRELDEFLIKMMKESSK